MDNTPENTEKQPVLPPIEQDEKQPFSKTFTARLDTQSYNRLLRECTENDLPLSTYAAMLIKKYWGLKDRNTPDTEQQPAKPFKQEQFKAKDIQHTKAMSWLQSKYPGYSYEELVSAALINVYENDRAWIFLTDFENSLKKVKP